jgi:predicted amidohydrolase
MSQLTISIIQPDIVWEDKAANLQQYEHYIGSIEGKKEIVVLPEMFCTGFSMAPERLAETMEGPTVQWMKDTARKHRCILTGSVIIEENGHYYNRLIWMQPDGNFGTYDKRHLFAYAGEHHHYSRGEKRLIAQVKGWRVCLQVCYDLRFPVWARNLDGEYDLLIYVANWPERRSLPWKTLLQARAIENQSFVVGVNRVGNDGNGIYHSGDSSVFGPLGETVWQQSHEATVHTLTLDKATVAQARTQFPFLDDADKFILI